MSNKKQSGLRRELVALLNLSSWCLAMVEWLFLAVPWGCLRFVIAVFPDHTHLPFLMYKCTLNRLTYIIAFHFFPYIISFCIGYNMNLYK